MKVIPMKSKSEVLPAMTNFAKKIGAPDTITTHATRKDKYQEVK